MAVIGATGIEPVNFLEQYAKGLQVGAGRRQLERQEIDRIKAEQEQLAVNDLIRANPNFREAVVQNQLMGMGPAGREALQAGLGLEQARNQMRKQDAEMQAMKFNQYRDRLLPVNDQNGWSSWRTSMIQEYSSTIPEIEAMIPEQFSPEAKMNMFATSESMVPMTEYQRRSIGVQEEQNRRLAAGVTSKPSSGAITSMVKPPDLQKGERWNAELGRVEAVEGSDIYIKQSGKHNKDYTALNAINNQRSLQLAKIDRLLAPENADAFNNLFGGYTAYASRELSGKTADLRSDLESLRNNLKAAGKKIIAGAGPGAIGQITEREWPILEGMIAELRPTMSEQGAKDKLLEIRVFLDNLANQAGEEYQTAWSQTQYAKPVKGASEPSIAPAAPAAAPVKVNSKAELDKLPSGSLYVGPDGKTRRKP